MNKPFEVGPEEIEVAYSGMAVRVDRFFLALTNGVVRLAFAEDVHGQRPRFRTAVVMSIPDLLELRKLLAAVKIEHVPAQTSAYEKH